MISPCHCLFPGQAAPSNEFPHGPFPDVFPLAAPSTVLRSLRWLCSALLLAGLMLGGLRADWDFAQISRRAQGLYGPLGEGQQRIDAWQQLLATQKQIPELEQLKVVD